MLKLKNLGNLLLALANFTLLFGCLPGDKPKTVGDRSLTLTSSAGTSAGTQNSFKFNFALRGTTSGADTPHYLQATTESKTGVVSTCNLAGTGCSCDFLNAASATLQSVTASYDTAGNYYTCTYNTSAGVLANVTQVRIRNNASTIASANLTIDTSITSASKLLGSDLDVNRIRTVYRYVCEMTFLQKTGTSATSFDCSNQATTCDGTNNFCLLKAQFPYFSYADNYQNNFSEVVPDKIYNGGGSGKICGIQIKQYDCSNYVNTSGAVKQFGLYAEQTGIWQTAIALGPGPDSSTSTYGFAASLNTTTNLCPPGLVKRVFYQLSVVTSDITPDHNFTTGQTSTDISSPTTTPPDFSIALYGDTGACSGTACTLPASYKGNAKADQSYSSTGQTTFCVVPSSVL